MIIKLKNCSGVIHTKDLSKLTPISKVREIVQELFKIDPAKQRLFYRGKQLDDEQTLHDYCVQKDDVIQVLERAVALPVSTVRDDKLTSPTSPAVDADQERSTEDEDKVTSLYFKVGDYVYCRDAQSGAWNDGKITGIVCKPAETVEQQETEGEKTMHLPGSRAKEKQNHLPEPEEEGLLFKVELDLTLDEGERNVVVNMQDIRACATASLKMEDLVVGMKVIANFNPDRPNEPGDWYEAEITKIAQSRTAGSVWGKILMGTTRLENCRITFCHDLKPMQPYVTLAMREPDAQENSINLEEPCGCCKGVPSKACKECNCVVCGGKDNEEEQILCDECNMAYHIGCLSPALPAVPTDDNWFCPDCKVDASEIVAPGAKLKQSKKKANSAAAKAAASGKPVRDWGRGNSTVGVSNKCTIVPVTHFGSIPGVEVGTTWALRILASEAGVHRPPVAGIAGRESLGAFSIVLSGGYEDDIDKGDEFFYTGSGGRDLSGNKRVAAQSFDQTLTLMNLALARNCDAAVNDKFGATATDWKKGKPVRVLRGYKLAKHSKYAPTKGVRYDGLYKVVRYFKQKGKSGFFVWRYVLRRDDPTPAPWTPQGKQFVEENGLDEIIGLQEQEEVQRAKDEEKKAGKKRKASDDTAAQSHEEVAAKKAKKIKAYEPDDTLLQWIKSDVNDKLWAECNSYLVQGKRIFMEKVREHFTCVCCCELVYKPVTTPCVHNICQACLRRSFQADVHTCPCCRLSLDTNCHLKVNDNLSQTLLALFPGYGNAR